MRLTRGLVRATVFIAVVMSRVATAWAQSPQDHNRSEDVEPRIIGQRGVTLLGTSGSLSRFYSSEDLFTGTYTVQVDGHHFITRKIALRFGAIGSDTFGGGSDDSDDDDSDDSDSSNDGTSTSLSGHAIEGLGGAVYYFTPESVWSFYGGGEYRARITNRLTNDIGAVNAIVGLQGALSSRASFFVEGGYGFRLRRGGEGELQTRIVGQGGVRFRF
jgi:hypothetical protein